MPDDQQPTTNNRQPTIARLSLLLAAPVAVLGLMWLALGRSAVEKVVTDALMPAGLLAVGLLGLAAVALWRRQWVTGGLAAVLMVLLAVAGNQIVADQIVGSLEAPFYELDPLAGPPLEQILLLGGASEETPAGGVQVNANGDRIVLAARLYHAGRTQTIFCSGRRTAAISRARLDEAEQARRLLLGLGVPDEAIRIIGGRNTSEEMQAIAEEIGEQPIGLVTNAWHLPRALRLARRSGLDPRPLPCGFATNPDAPYPWGAAVRDLVPHHDALADTGRAMKEYLAAVVGR